VLTTYTECNTIAELRSSSAGQFLETTAIVVNAALVPLHTVAACGQSLRVVAIAPTTLHPSAIQTRRKFTKKKTGLIMS